MNRLRKFVLRLRGLLWKRKVDRDLDEEFPTLLNTLTNRVPLQAAVLGVALAVAIVAGVSAAQNAKPWWPTSGTVILCGGHLDGETGGAILDRLIALAGGPDALIVVIPTASEGLPEQLTPGSQLVRIEGLRHALESRGAHRVAFLHTRDRKTADSEAFVKDLRLAGGVFIPGGAARLIENTYRGTLVEQELKALLQRGGVIAGDSAGAMAIGCLTLGWTPDPFGKVTDGLCLMTGVAVTPHASAARGYVVDEEVLNYLNAHSGLIGIDLDENTALILRGSSAEVVGKGRVAIVDPLKDKTKPYLRLSAGDKRELNK
jgi:cyanophycinase